MFYLTDVHKTRQHEEDDDEQQHEESDAAEGDDNPSSSKVPDSTQRLFAQMLLRCDVSLTNALQLRASDVDPVGGRLSVPADETMETDRTLSLSDTLVRGFRRHLDRIMDRTTDDDPLLFGDWQEEDAPDAEDASDAAERARRSTELATRVMRTFDQDELHE
jgi:hypothetical protein